LVLANACILAASSDALIAKSAATMFTPGRAKGGYGRIREAAATAAGDGTVPAAAAATPVGAISSSTAGFRQPSSPWASPALTPSRYLLFIFACFTFPDS